MVLLQQRKHILAKKCYGSRDLIGSQPKPPDPARGVRLQGIGQIGIEFETASLDLLFDRMLTIVEPGGAAAGKAAALLQIQVHVTPAPCAEAVESHDLIAEYHERGTRPGSDPAGQPIDLEMYALSHLVNAHV